MGTEDFGRIDVGLIECLLEVVHLRKKNRITGAVLCAMLCFTACGNQPEAVTDYGGTAERSSSEAPGVTATESGGTTEAGGGKSGVNYSGKLPPIQDDGDPVYEDSFTIASKPVEVNITSVEYDTELLRTYRVSKITEDKLHEEEIVRNLFGDTAKELRDEISSDAGDAERIVAACRKYDNEVQGIESDEVQAELSEITGKWNVGPAPAWGNGENLFWHTYEGIYEGVTYQLTIAYRKDEKIRYITFYPKNPGDVVNDPELTQLMSFTGAIYTDTATNETLRQVWDQPNQSEKSEEELRRMAEEFTTEKLCGRLPMEDLSLGTVNYATEDGTEERPCQLLFSTDLFGEESPRGRVDGYELKCNWTHTGTLDFKDGNKDAGNNSGWMFVTDHGVIGASLVYSYELQEELSEQVEILPFEKVMTALREQLPERFDPAKINGTNLVIGSATLAFYPVESPDKPGEATFVPVWCFWAGSNGGVGVIILNAMDGSLIHIEYVH